MTVSNQQTEFPYTGNGVTVTFAYSCQVQKASDLQVYVNGVPVTSGITKNGIGSLSGGSVTFSVAPASGAAVRLERVVVLERTTDYQQNGDFLARVVNPDFDRLWMALQQFVSNFTRVLRFPKSDINPKTELPPAASRANKLFGFDSNGNPLIVAPISQSAVDLIITLATSAGASLIGWVQSGVGAIIRTVQDKLRDIVSVKDFGAVGDAVTDDTAAFQAAFEYARTNYKTVYIPSGNYIVGNLYFGTNSSSGQSSHPLGLIGDGLSSKMISKAGTSGYVLNARNTTGIVLEKFIVIATGCFGIDTSWSGPGPSIQSIYSFVWVDGYTTMGWNMDNNNDCTMIHLHARNPTGADPVGFSCIASGGMFAMSDCFWYNAKLVAGWQNGVLEGCSGMGIHFNAGGSYNATTISGSYIYSNSVSQRALWTSNGQRVSGLSSKSTLWAINGQPGQPVIDGVFNCGITFSGDVFDANPSATGRQVLSNTITTYNGNGLHISFDHCIFEGTPLAVGVPSASNIVVETRNLQINGTGVADVTYTGSTFGITQKNTATSNILSLSGVDPGYVRRSNLVTATQNTWYELGSSSIYRGVGTVKIFGLGNDSPFVNASFGRPGITPIANQIVLHQSGANANGVTIELQWGGGQSLQWRYTGGSAPTIPLRVAEDYLSA